MQGRGSVKGCDLSEELESRGPQEGNGKGSQNMIARHYCPEGGLLAWWGIPCPRASKLLDPPREGDAPSLLMYLQRWESPQLGTKNLSSQEDWI